MKHFTLSDGTIMAYQEMGEGRPVILTHGWTGESSQYWPDVMPILAEAGFRAIGIDCRGSGKTSRSTVRPVKQSMWVDDLHEFMEGLKLKDCTLVGSSMGATTIMMYIKKYGNDEHVHSIVFVDQCPCITKKEGWDLGMMLGNYTLEEGLAAHAVMSKDFYEYYKGFCIAMEPKVQELPEAKLKAYVEDMMTHFYADESTELFLDSQYADSRDAIPMIKVPTAYFYAGQSQLYKPEVADYYKATIPAPVVTKAFPSSNHLFFMDMPEAFSEELIRFMKEY